MSLENVHYLHDRLAQLTVIRGHAVPGSELQRRADQLLAGVVADLTFVVAALDRDAGPDEAQIVLAQPDDVDDEFTALEAWAAGRFG